MTRLHGGGRSVGGNLKPTYTAVQLRHTALYRRFPLSASLPHHFVLLAGRDLQSNTLTGRAQACSLQVSAFVSAPLTMAKARAKTPSKPAAATADEATVAPHEPMKVNLYEVGSLKGALDEVAREASTTCAAALPRVCSVGRSLGRLICRAHRDQRPVRAATTGGPRLRV